MVKAPAQDQADWFEETNQSQTSEIVKSQKILHHCVIRLHKNNLKSWPWRYFKNPSFPCSNHLAIHHRTILVYFASNYPIYLRTLSDSLEGSLVAHISYSKLGSAVTLCSLDCPPLPKSPQRWTHIITSNKNSSMTLNTKFSPWIGSFVKPQLYKADFICKTPIRFWSLIKLSRSKLSTSKITGGPPTVLASNYSVNAAASKLTTARPANWVNNITHRIDSHPQLKNSPKHYCNTDWNSIEDNHTKISAVL